MGGLEAELVPRFLCPVSSNLQDKVGGGTEGGTGVQSLEGGLRDPSSSVNYDSVQVFHLALRIVLSLSHLIHNAKFYLNY